MISRAEIDSRAMLVYRLQHGASEGYHSISIQDVLALLSDCDMLAQRSSTNDAPPVAWRVFNGEGGYDYMDYVDNEDYRDNFVARNGPQYKNWVEPLYTLDVCPEISVGTI